MIEVKELTKKFGTAPALDNISFSIGGGSVFGLVGSNGAGKSTLLRVMAGVYRPDGGNVFIDGQPPFENAAVKGRVCFISDYPYFMPQYSMDDMAEFFAGIYPNWSQKRYLELSSLFPLERRARITNMSKGMQRQAAIITALSAQPDYLLLDEIFDGLDPVMRQLLKRLLSSEVGERGMTAVIASHNLRELEDLCDHVGLLHRGGVVFEKELDSLKLGIHKVQAVLKPMPEPEAFEGLDVIKSEIRGSLINLVVRGDQDSILERLNRLEPVFLEAIPLTLEEVFISEMEAAGYDIDNILK